MTLTPKFSSDAGRDLVLISQCGFAERLVWKTGSPGETHRPRR